MGRNKEATILERRIPRPEPDILDAAHVRDDLSIRANDVVEISAGLI